MRISILASGSKGNSTYIETSFNKILIDLGITSLQLTEKLYKLGIEPDTINGILITHTHGDHIDGLKAFLKKYHPKLYLTKKMYEYLKTKIEITRYEIIEDYLQINDLEVKVINTSHDVPSVGYLLKSNNKEIVYITDTGYLHEKYHHVLKNKDIYIIESNHDIEMLLNGNYPYYLKQRIYSSKGHLSNRDCSYYLSKFIGDNTKHIILAHLSEDNNIPELALSTLKTTLGNNNIEFNNIIIASQYESTELLEI